MAAHILEMRICLKDDLNKKTKTKGEDFKLNKIEVAKTMNSNYISIGDKIFKGI